MRNHLSLSSRFLRFSSRRFLILRPSLNCHLSQCFAITPRTPPLMRPLMRPIHPFTLLSSRTPFTVICMLRRTSAVFVFDIHIDLTALSSIQHLTESDLAFEEKQRVAKRTSKRSGGSKGIVKRYDKPQRNQAEEKATPMVAFPLVDPLTTLHGVVWSNGGTTMHRNRQVSCSLPADSSIQRRNLAPMDPPSSAGTRTDPPV